MAPKTKNAAVQKKSAKKVKDPNAPKVSIKYKYVLEVFGGCSWGGVWVNGLLSSPRC